MSTTQRPPIAEEIARRLAAALRGAQLYAPDHPIVKRNVSALAETMTVALGVHPTLPGLLAQGTILLLFTAAAVYSLVLLPARERSRASPRASR